MSQLKLTENVRVGDVMRATPDFERILRREGQYNLLRIMGEWPNVRTISWWTICRAAGLTEIEIRLLNDVLAKAAKPSHPAA